MDIVIQPLTPERVRQYLDFFDHAAFADNPKWQFCYCNFLFHDPAHGRFAESKPEANRAAVEKRICARAMHGHLAFDGGRAIGWCQAAPRTTIPALRDEPDPDGAAGQTGSIVCFVIAKDYRCRGVARRLLGAACETFRTQGLRYAEGYPRAGLTDDGENHYGPLSMYLSAGFAPFRESDGTTVVRKQL